MDSIIALSRFWPYRYAALRQLVRTAGHCQSQTRGARGLQALPWGWIHTLDVRGWFSLGILGITNLWIFWNIGIEKSSFSIMQVETLKTRWARVALGPWNNAPSRFSDSGHPSSIACFQFSSQFSACKVWNWHHEDLPIKTEITWSSFSRTPITPSLVDTTWKSHRN